MAALLASSQSYLRELLGMVPPNHPLLRIASERNKTGNRTFYAGSVQAESLSRDFLLDLVRKDRAEDIASVCIIENIDIDLICGLGAAWNLEHDFFIQYTSNPPARNLWEQVKSTSQWARDETHFGQERWHHHLEGVIPHLRSGPEGGRRVSDFDDDYGCQAYNRISYIRVWNKFYLFLVDGPVFMNEDVADSWPSRLSLWLQYSSNRGGIPIPQNYSEDCFSAFDSLQTFFHHHWHLEFLAATEPRGSAIDPVIFVYTWAASSWKTNLRAIEDDIKKIAFKSIKRADLDVNDRLIDRRHDLHTLTSEVGMTGDYLSPQVEKYYKNVGAEIWVVWSPQQALDDILEDAEQLGAFLATTFDMLMSSASVGAAMISIQQTKRSNLLTQLAAIYLPISLVTGIFGMNVHGINDAPSWSCAIALGIILILTGIMIWIMRRIPRLDPGRSAGQTRYSLAPGKKTSISRDGITGRKRLRKRPQTRPGLSFGVNHTQVDGMSWVHRHIETD